MRYLFTLDVKNVKIWLPKELDLIRKKEQVRNIFLYFLVGQFHSTKILEFTFACSNCGNRIKVETDPENCDYKFTDGAYRIVFFFL